MQQVFKVRLPNGTETYMNDRLILSLQEREEQRKKTDRDCALSENERLWRECDEGHK